VFRFLLTGRWLALGLVAVVVAGGLATTVFVGRALLG